MAKKKQTQQPIQKDFVVGENQVDGYVVVQNFPPTVYATSKFTWSAHYKEAWIHDDINRANQVAMEMRKHLIEEYKAGVKIAKVVRTTKLETTP